MTAKLYQARLNGALLQADSITAAQIAADSIGASEIAPGAVTGRGPVLLVAAIGASTKVKEMADYLCDGSSDQVEINAALAALPAAGGTVLLSEGAFFLDGGITTAKNSSSLIGAGFIATSIYTLAGWPASTSMVTLAHSFCRLADLTLDGNKSSNSGVTTMRCWNITAANCLVQNVVAQNSAGNGVQMSGVAGCAFINCQVNYADSVGFVVDGTTGAPTQVIGCRAISNGGAGFYIMGTQTQLVGCAAQGNNGAGFQVIAGAVDAVLEACQARANLVGFQSDSTTRTTFQSCAALGSNTYGFSTAAGTVAIVGCTVYGSTSSYGIYINGGASHLVSGCKIQNNGGYGIHAAVATACLIVGNHVSDSSLAGPAGYAQILISSNDSYVMGNTCRMAGSGNRPNYGIQILAGTTNVLLGQNDLYNSGVTGDFSDGGTNTRRSPTRSATWVIAASNASASSKAGADVVCSGTADQTIIQAAINALGAAGGTVRLTEGLFTISAGFTIQNNCSLIGMGDVATVIKAANGAGNYSMVILGSSTMLRALRVDGNVTNNPSATNGAQVGVYVPNTNSVVEHVTVVQGAAFGIFTETSSADVRIRNCVVANCVTNYICRAAAGDVTRFTDCISLAAAGTGFSNDAGTGAVILSGCVVIGGAGHGISLGSQWSVADHCWVRRAGQNGIVAGGPAVRVTNCSVFESSQAQDVTYSNIHVSGTYCYIQGNVVRYGSQTNRPVYGIVVATGATNTMLGPNDVVFGGFTQNILDQVTDTKRIHKVLADFQAVADLTPGGGTAVVVAPGATDLPGSTVNFTVLHTNSIVVITVRGYIMVGGAGVGAGSEYGSRIVIDGSSPIRPLGGDTVQVASSFVNVLAGAGPVVFNGTLAAGAHSVKVQVMGTPAATMHCRPTSVPNVESFSLHVVEYMP